MSGSEIIDILLDSLKDSLIVFAICLAIHIGLSFMEIKVVEKLKKKRRTSPLFGALLGLIPECGVSIVGADLYIKEHITMGTIVAIFLSCSDEAIPLLIANHSNKSLMAIALVALKFAIGFIVGFVTDLIFKDGLNVHNHLERCNHVDTAHSGCCKHLIDEEESPFDKHVLHPIKHSLKVFAYVLAINLSFGILIGFVGMENISAFLITNKYLTPVFSALIGLIPNCASSILLTETYLLDGIPFGAMVSGLLMNSGLGMIYLLRNRSKRKKTALIVSICFIASIVSGYLICLASGF